eukprot:266718_1
MYDNMETLFREDIATLRRFCQLAQPEHVVFLDEIEKQFLTEFDYRREAQNLLEIGNNLKAEWSRKVKVPRPELDMCTRRILVMEYIPGEKLISAVMRKYEAIAKSKGMTLSELQKQYMSSSSSEEQVSPDPFQMALFRVAVSSRDFIWNSLAFAVNITFGFAFWGLGHSSFRIIPYMHTPFPLDTAALTSLLVDVHGYELFVNGAFNGDPHAGNILLMPDGRLGLIDYGQVKHLDQKYRIRFARLILELAREHDTGADPCGTNDSVVAAMREMGYITKHSNPTVLCQNARLFFDRDSPDVTEGMMVPFFMEELHRRDPLTHMPDEYVMVNRVSFMLRGTSAALGHQVSTAKMWRPFAERFLKECGEEY